MACYVTFMALILLCLNFSATLALFVLRALIRPSCSLFPVQVAATTTRPAHSADCIIRYSADMTGTCSNMCTRVKVAVTLSKQRQPWALMLPFWLWDWIPSHIRRNMIIVTGS
ncbi:hypothetical protein CEXT_313691 [Caerostris extrusa]|uniref:Secreted protein n=1 Tax=Caerostris extrusa TaxID=172846 RepID=A0AAV4N066_CAEEX|nr:hypothetical protein CEXT_313691 [Caerostris extrusa]